ncbi:protein DETOXIFICATION 42-like isoform X1 [Salvia splendens]|uniref:protein DETOXIFICATION 42-like isoform X1 n=1 Tax=Salvia splendens TaxID=180675 RepID=UPI001C2766A6|nr:protein DETOXIFICATION 42-like isoform X1 [Salvia splendens]XP_042008242.1 protein DETOXIFICATION 42-like isoform X1 [Salvia splendens]
MAEQDFTSSENPQCILLKDVRSALKPDELGVEIATIAIPAAMALTADPIASLIDTAFIGQIGPVELAAVGVAIALFNQISRIAIFPLVSVTTSFVAEEDAMRRAGRLDFEEDVLSSKDSEKKMLIPQKGNSNANSHLLNSMLRFKFYRIPSAFFALGLGEKMPSLDSQKSLEVGVVAQGKKHIASAPSALIIGGILGILQAVFLITAARPLLSFMGVKYGSEMSTPAEHYLKLRSLGAPAVLLSLAMQGVFRGLKDTKTPLYATVSGDIANIILDPIFIFVLKMGVRGAATAHVISQYLIALILFWRLQAQVDLLSPSLEYLQLGRFIKNGFQLLTRVIAVTFCVTLAASLAARLGSTEMAAFQVCLQVWLASSLMADGLAVAGQAILASAFARKDYNRAAATAARVLQLGIVLGLCLAVMLGFGLHFGARIFTQDPDVLHLIGVGVPFVAATQPINSLAFVFDGVNFGASDFAYSAYSMVIVAIASISALFFLSSTYGFVGIWIALTFYMSFRAFAGFWRIGTATGPWKFLRS